LRPKQIKNLKDGDLSKYKNKIVESGGGDGES
jgi:hypothetical protein